MTLSQMERLALSQDREALSRDGATLSQDGAALSEEQEDAIRGRGDAITGRSGIIRGTGRRYHRTERYYHGAERRWSGCLLPFHPTACHATVPLALPCPPLLFLSHNRLSCRAVSPLPRLTPLQTATDQHHQQHQTSTVNMNRIL